MNRKIIVFVLIALCVASFASHRHGQTAVNAFKIDQIGVKM